MRLDELHVSVEVSVISSHFCRFMHVYRIIIPQPPPSLSLAPAVLRVNVQHGNIPR